MNYELHRLIENTYPDFKIAGFNWNNRDFIELLKIALIATYEKNNKNKVIFTRKCVTDLNISENSFLSTALSSNTYPGIWEAVSREHCNSDTEFLNDINNLNNTCYVNIVTYTKSIKNLNAFLRRYPEYTNQNNKEALLKKAFPETRKIDILKINNFWTIYIATSTLSYGKELMENIIPYIPAIINWDLADITDIWHKVIDCMIIHKENYDTTQRKAVIDSAINELATTLELDKKLKEKQLELVATTIANAQKTQVQARITTEQQIITRYELELSQAYKKLREASLAMMGLETETKDIKDLQKILLNDMIKNIAVNNGQIQLQIQSPLKIFDQHYATRLVQKKADKLCRDEIRKIFEELFVNEDTPYMLYTNIAVQLNTTTGAASSLPSSTAPGMRQPHLFHYNCWGTYTSKINKAFLNGEYMLWIQTILAATQNINFTDATVLSRFLTDIERYYKDYNCIYNTETKTWCTFKKLKESLTNAENQTES